MAGLVGVMGYTQPASPQPTSPGRAVLVTSGNDTSSAIATSGTSGTSGTSPETLPTGNTTLTARPIVRQAPPTDPAPTASTSGSH